MKHKFLLFAILFISLSINAQIHYKGNTVLLTGSAIGESNTSTGSNSFVAGQNSISTGNQSMALGKETESNGTGSFSIGSYSKADANYSGTLGSRATAMGTGSIAIGNKVDALGIYCYVIGYGKPYNYLQNNINYSLMMGFNSNVPTFFVGPSANVDLSGKIGIGNITAPEAKLHIKADASENADLFLDPRNASNFAILKLGSENNRIEAKQISDLSFYTNQDFYFANGEVGIGTSTPSALLDVNGDLRVQEIARFDSPVGIGTSSPDEQLHVIGNQILTGTIDINGTSYLNGITLDNDSDITNANQIIGQNDLHLSGDNTGGTDIFIAADGAVGIGTTSTNDAELTIAGKTKTTSLQITNNHSAGRLLQSDTYGNAIWTDVAMNDDDWIIDDDNVYKLNGNVGIGTNEFSSSTALLLVNGKLEAEEIEVKTINTRDVGEWKDLVFKDDYTLLSLDEVEQFIKENGHLPDIPSEEEVLQNGYNMGDMDALLLQKIEELTLYIIELEKKLK